MKFFEEHFALIISGLFGGASNLLTWFIATRKDRRKRKESLEGRYTELLDKYLELSNKYVEIIDKISEIEITNHALKQEVEQLTNKQCTQCQQQK